ncbi:hypothetical protein M408DRAFT_232295 [Serendipita vermifera MAFF 305830]|uniref:Uncharacterized protein n=1 Tax=Serendipita vermifera MAFF 305830 TaxID=933852 RepID=A0A0C3AWZ4_SERVB|nr:hypothetical protein M408DRAFT_232295 [Serendipita vermifera MAFF 305830]
MPFPVSPNSPDATTLNETTLINTPTSPEQDQGVVAASPSVTAIASATSQTRLPRPHLAPLLIVRTPSLANVMAYTASPSPSPLRVRFRPAASRSFSAPILFAGNRERLSPSSMQDTDSLDASESRLFFPRARPKAYYSPGIDGYASSTSSPKIDLKLEFEPVTAVAVFEEQLLKSRFSSGSTIIPNKSKWYKPKLSFRHKNTDRILRSELAAVPGTNSIPSRSPNSDKQGRTIPGRRSGGESASFARAHPGRNQVNPMVDGIPPIATSGRWSADWDNVISQI